MRCFTGIDLGSTTTKAVILDEEGRVLGRGITNSRSNYDAACAVARTEAEVAARFELLQREIEREPLLLPCRKGFLDDLLRNLRLEQYLEQLGCLAGSAEQRAVSRSSAGSELVTAISAILARMRDEAPDLFTPGREFRSDFFRDVAASRFGEFAAQRRGGSASFEALLAVFDGAILSVENTVLGLSFKDHIGRALDRCLADGGRLAPAAAAALTRAVTSVAAVELEDSFSIGTGYGRARLPFPRERIRSEILCHGLGAHRLFPATATVLDIGGQDTKAIQVDPAGLVTSFQMNDRCAAGCGRYLGYIADEMNLGLHELGPIALRSSRTVRINSTCTVFAGAELRERMLLGDKQEDILAGLHRAICLRAMSLLARSGGVHDELTFTGGVAKNLAAVAALKRLVAENYGDVTINISPDSIYTGALGAAMFARREVGAA